MQQQACGTPLPFSHCENFRELGGYCGAEGKKVRHGLFYRTPALANLKTQEDITLFTALGVRTVLDFRSSMERTAQPDPAFEGVENIAVSALVDAEGNEINFDFAEVFARGQEAIEHLQDTLLENYVQMPFGNPAYQALFAALATQRVPVLFHCTAGKDRTGVAAALILKALGVSRADIVADYLQTNACWIHGREHLASLLAQRISPQVAQMLAQTMGGVQEESIQAVLDAIDARYPDYAEYLQAECAFDHTAQANLRAWALE